MYSSKTWAAGGWRFTDSNTYIRDNLTSLRRGMVSDHCFFEQPATFLQAGTNGLGASYQYTNLCASTPDEPMRADVVVLFRYSTVTGGATFMNILVAADISIVGFQVIANYPATEGAANGQWCAGAAELYYAAGVNPSVTVSGTCDGSGSTFQGYMATLIHVGPA